jgi:ketosteroid isomerase-like protein
MAAPTVNGRREIIDMNNSRALKTFVLVTVVLAVLAAHVEVTAEERCCLNNFRYAGGCMVVVRGQETCQDVLAYLNNFNSVGKYYCDNTTIRGGWSLGPCGDPAVHTSPYVAPQNAQPGRPAQQAKPSPQITDPGTAPAAKDASLMKVSAPLQVRFGADVNSASQSTGQIVTGVLEENLMSGDTVIAPAGSEVQFRIVPTSYWTDGGGDAFEIQATAVKVGDELIPLDAIAVSATGEIDTSGEEVNVPEGSLVSFETRAADQGAVDEQALESGAARWMAAFNAKDIDAMTALCAEDAVLLPPDAPAVFGRDAVLATMQEMFASGLAIELEDLEIKAENDLGYKAGRYRLRSEDGALVDRGKYIEIWTKVDGKWVLHRDIWNSSVQPEVEDTQE